MLRSGAEPASRRNDDLAGLAVEPGSPPAECAVGNDVMVAKAHPQQVVQPTAGVGIEDVVAAHVVAAPGEIVGEQQVVDTRAKARRGGGMVVAAKAMEAAGQRLFRHIVRAAQVDGDQRPTRPAQPRDIRVRLAEQMSVARL
jgi:hypothetical protein